MSAVRIGMAVRCLATIVVVMSLSEPYVAAAQAQVVDMSARELEYAESLSSILDAWSAGKVTFGPRVDFDAEFKVRFERFSVRQADAYAGYAETAIDPAFIMSNWQLLPEEATSVFPLTAGARLVLIGGIVDAAAALEEMGIEPEFESLLEGLNFSLYVTLAAAQEETAREGDNEIDAVAVRRGGMWLFSLGWPFCCAQDPPPDSR